MWGGPARVGGCIDDVGMIEGLYERGIPFRGAKLSDDDQILKLIIKSSATHSTGSYHFLSSVVSLCCRLCGRGSRHKQSYDEIASDWHIGYYASTTRSFLTNCDDAMTAK